MKFKNWKILSPFIIFGICSLVHFIFDLFPNIITSFFAPVNESIIEHMKMIYTSIFIFSIIEMLLLKKWNINTNNKYFNIFISGLVNIFAFLILYLPTRTIFKENMIITFIILFISNIITSYVSYKLLLSKKLINNKMALILSLIVYIPFIFFTYNPMHNNLFYDSKNETYGIKKNA